MTKLFILVEDNMHKEFCLAFIDLMSQKYNLRKDSISVEHIVSGGSKIYNDFNDILKILSNDNILPFDKFIIFIDSDCNVNNVRRTIAQNLTSNNFTSPTWMIQVIPSPQIERWFFADIEAFSTVLGLGNIAEPEIKCKADYYKKIATDYIARAKIYLPESIVFDYVYSLDLGNAKRKDDSLNNFVTDLESFFRIIENTN